jgi:hypothetical protein
MKRFSSLLLTFFGIFSLNVANAQTADEIINKNLEAMGGKDKLKSVKSLQVESSFKIMGIDAPTTRYWLDGKAYKMENVFGYQKNALCSTDTGGWSTPTLGQPPEPLPWDAQKALKIQTHVYPLLNYSASGNKVELLGRDSVNGVYAYKIKFTSPDSVQVLYYFDPSTYYILELVTIRTIRGLDATTSVYFSNYQKTDFGVMCAMKELIIFQGITIDITNKEIDINKDIDPKIFLMCNS